MEKKEQEVTGVQATLKGSATMATYNTAVEKFSKSSSSFMEMLQHLSQARDAYQEAITASAELRNVLDAGDEALRSIASAHQSRTTPHLLLAHAGLGTLLLPT